MLFDSNTAFDSGVFGYTYAPRDSSKISFLVLGVVCKGPMITDILHDAGQLQGNTAVLLEE